MTITDRDREAGWAAMRAADHACGLDAKAECYAAAIAQAREEERLEEREAIINDLALTTRYDLGGLGSVAPSMGGDYMDVRETFEAIRARGDATLPAADAASEV